VNAETQDANADVASMVDEIKVNENVMPTLCERPKITHHADCQQDTV